MGQFSKYIQPKIYNHVVAHVRVNAKRRFSIKMDIAYAVLAIIILWAFSTDDYVCFYGSAHNNGCVVKGMNAMAAC